MTVSDNDKLHKKKKGKKRPKSKKRLRKADMPTPAQRRRKKRRTRRRLCLAALSAALLCAVCFALWYFSFRPLDLGDYVTVAYSGYDTQATAALSLRKSPEYQPFLKGVKIRLLNENGRLKNGDLLDIRFLYDEEEAKEQKLRIASEEYTVEVSGLPKGRRLTNEDLFRGLKVSYDGTAPQLTVSLSNESSDPFLRTVSYEILQPADFYDLGDTFTVKASFSEQEAIQNEYIADLSDKTTQKEYTVAGADSYLREPSELSKEQLQTLNEAAAALFGDATEYGLRIFSEANLMPIWVNGKTTFVWSRPRLISAYLNVLRPEYYADTAMHTNDLKLVYTARLSQADGVSCDAEVVVQFNGLIQRADGSYDLGLDSGRIIAASYRNSNIRDLVTNSYDKEYEAKKINVS